MPHVEDPEHARSGVAGRSPDLLSGLAALARGLSSARVLNDVLEAAAERARFAFDADAASLSRLEREHGLIRTLVNAGHLADGEERWPSDETYLMADYPLLQVTVNDVRSWRLDVDDPEGDPAELALLRRLDAASVMAVPLIAEGKVWGELWLTRRRNRPVFDDADLQLAEVYAAVVSFGLAQVAHRERLERLAYEDELTGVSSRRYALEVLDGALLERAEQPGFEVGLLMVDVNGLKAINDRYGHDRGDELIRTVATGLSVAASSVPRAVVGRLGGDEFCLVVPGADLATVERLGLDVLAHFARQADGPSVAIGVVSTEQFPTSSSLVAADLLGHADLAQYEAKRDRATVPYRATVTEVSPPMRHGRRQARDADAATAVPISEVALTSGLDALAEAGADPAKRLAITAESIAEDYAAVGWVVSRLRRGAADPVLSECRRDGVLVQAVPARLQDGWLIAASRHGVVVGPEHPAPLPRARGVDHVVAAAVDHWLVEVLLDDAAPPGAAAALRALAGSAVAPP